jgi:hypothetical protein
MVTSAPVPGRGGAGVGELPQLDRFHTTSPNVKPQNNNRLNIHFPQFFFSLTMVSDRMPRSPELAATSCNPEPFVQMTKSGTGVIQHQERCEQPLDKYSESAGEGKEETLLSS